MRGTAMVRSWGGHRIFRSMPALLVLLVAALVLAGCGAGDPPRVAAPPTSIGTPTDQPLPQAIKRLPLLDTSGKTVRLADFHGKVLVIDDFMTLCQETCPLDTANFVATARAVANSGLGKKVEFVSITVDPSRDTPKRLAAYRKLFDPAPPNWLTLTTSPSDIAKLWHHFGVYYQRQPEGNPPGTDWLTGKPLTFDVSHSDDVFFLDTSGHERFLISGPGHLAKGTPLPMKLGDFLNEEGRHNRDHPSADSWTVPQALRVVSWLTNRNIKAP